MTQKYSVTSGTLFSMVRRARRGREEVSVIPSRVATATCKQPEQDGRRLSRRAGRPRRRRRRPSPTAYVAADRAGEPPGQGQPEPGAVGAGGVARARRPSRAGSAGHPVAVVGDGDPDPVADPASAASRTVRRACRSALSSSGARAAADHRRGAPRPSRRRRVERAPSRRRGAARPGRARRRAPRRGGSGRRSPCADAGHREHGADRGVHPFGGLDDGAQRLGGRVARSATRVSASCASVRITDSGVRSSWATSSVSRRSASRAWPIRSSIRSSVCASSVSSSRGGPSANRPDRSCSRQSSARRAIRRTCRRLAARPRPRRRRRRRPRERARAPARATGCGARPVS